MKNKKVRDSFKDKPCLVCGSIPSDPCHIRTYGATREDNPLNMLALCRRHHSLQHAKGWAYMFDSFPLFASLMSRRGFYIESVFGIRKLVSK